MIACDGGVGAFLPSRRVRRFLLLLEGGGVLGGGIDRGYWEGELIGVLGGDVDRGNERCVTLSWSFSPPLLS